MQKAIQIPYDTLFELNSKFVSEAGFSAISINYSEVNEMSEDGWKRITEHIHKVLDSNGLKCIQSHLPGYEFWDSSEIPDEAADFKNRQAIISGAELGVKYGVIHPRTSFTSAFRTSKSIEDNKAILSGLLDCAIKCGTGIAVENLPIFPDCKDIIPFFSSNFEDIATLTDYFADERMGICWDFGHANLMYWDQATAIDFLGKRIKCTHIHNNFTFYDDHCPPDTGTVDWGKVLGALKRTGYEGALTLETHCRIEEPSILQSFFRHNFVCLEYLDRLMNGE